MGLERGHRTLTITRKGGKIVTIPLAPRTARAIDLSIGERCEGPIFLGPGGQRLGHVAGRIVRRVADPGATFAVTGDTVFGLSPDRHAVLDPGRRTSVEIVAVPPG